MKPYVIVRTNQAGCFAGILENRTGAEATLTSARRLWYWSGAATLSEMAMLGVANPDRCKFPAAVDRITVLEVVEILDTTPTARDSIERVPVWTAHPKA